MAPINKVLRCLINKNENFCCLCLDMINEEKIIRIEDDVMVNINGNETMLYMSEILQLVFGKEVSNYIHCIQLHSR